MYMWKVKEKDGIYYVQNTKNERGRNSVSIKMCPLLFNVLQKQFAFRPLKINGEQMKSSLNIVSPAK